MMSQHTGLFGAARPCRPVQTHNPIPTELCIGRQPIEHFQPINGHPSVIIGCNPQRFLEAFGTVDTGSCPQNPQYVPLRDLLMMLSPTSFPQTSGKTSETQDIQKEAAQTFENDSTSGAPKVAKRVQGQVGHNIQKFRFIGENIELVSMPKILGRVNFDIVTIFFRRCREFCIKMRIIRESQTFLLIL